MLKLKILNKTFKINNHIKGKRLRVMNMMKNMNLETDAVVIGGGAWDFLQH